MSIKPFLTLFSMEFRAWLRVKINLFFVIAWPLIWLLMMTLVIPSTSRGSMADTLLFYFPSCMALVTLSAMISLAIRIAVKKEAGILQRLKVVPFPVFAYFAVQFLCAIAMSLLGLACICILAFIMKMPLKFSPFALALLFLLCCFCFSAIGFFIAGISWKIATANILSMLVMFLMMFMSDMFIPASDLQNVVHRIGAFLPAQPFLVAARGMMLGGMRLSDYPSEILVIGAWGIGALALALPTFKFDTKK